MKKLPWVLCGFLVSVVLAVWAAGLQPASLLILPGTITANLCAPGVCAGSSGGGTIPPSTASPNSFWGGPASGSAGAPSFRSLVAADIPTLQDTQIALSTVLAGQSNQAAYNALTRSYLTEYTCNTPLVCTFGTDGSTGNQTLTLSTSGEFIQTQYLATGTTTLTVSSRTHTVRVRMVGPGGGGASAQVNTTGNGSVGGGGSAGAYCEFTATVTPSTGYVVSLPSGGAGGASSGANNGGVASGNATITIPVSGTVYTATAGLGGVALGTQATVGTALGAQGPAVSSNCGINGGGAPGQLGALIAAAGAAGYGGVGGSSPFGGGGGAVKNTAGGVNATGCGAGGGGALSGSGGAGQAGGNGSGACAVVDEYQ